MTSNLVNLVVGAIAIGRSGTSGIVTEIESDRVTVELSDGLKKRVPISSIASWEPPPLVADQRVRFIGDVVLFRELNRGEILEVVEDCGEWVRVRTANRKPVSVLRSDLGLGDGDEDWGDTDLKESPTSPSLTRFVIGDRVRYVGGIWQEFLGDCRRQVFDQRTGIITDTNHLTLTDSPDRFEVEWGDDGGDDWAGCRWFEELDLEAIA
jgi:hypothetical protein